MIDLLRTRRSIRKFTEQPIEPEKLEILKEAILRAPTSKNSNACEYIFIDAPELLQKLALCKPHGAASLQTAKLAIAVLVDESKTVAWIEDSSIAAFIGHLTAHSLGLGSCWIQIRGREYSEEKTSEAYVCETLHIPEGFRVLSIVAIGYAQRSHEGKPLSDLNFGKIHSNRF
ncbi:nitroreductase family protein [Aquipluma nitroreducens]|nr:nitroreductase family protein [Aquipluma nitroreducens]